MLAAQITPRFLREQTIGVNQEIETPFGKRILSYCDYTASGRGLKFTENYLRQVLKTYANSHTEDDATGRQTTDVLLAAEKYIKESVNAGEQGKLIACGAGATGAISKLQQILGVAIAPATRDFLQKNLSAEGFDLEQLLQAKRPVVFVGPYEHHSNEISWRESLCEIVGVALGDDGQIDLDDLQRLLQLPEYKNRLRIGSFSAASNVTGILSPVNELARLLHQHDAFAFFDYAASAPYVQIDMNPSSAEFQDAWLDAVFISPHKFLGGPGAAGILVFNERCYRKELPPSFAGGGTVTFVWPQGHDFIKGIEEREKAGTPAILQTIKAALAFKVKDAVGAKKIAHIEHDYTQQAMQRLLAHPKIEVLGNPEPENRIGIISFNILCKAGKYLHPRFVTVLLNDLFGIQTRAGCSCAGPYAHSLLGLDAEKSQAYREWINKGYPGVRPGWCRFGLHYTCDQAEVDFILSAIEFVADKGHLFLSVYQFDVSSGKWSHKDQVSAGIKFSMQEILATHSERAIPSLSERQKIYQEYLAFADRAASKLEDSAPIFKQNLQADLAEVQYFYMP